MKIAVLSDIHCNCFALEAVLAEVNAERPDQILVLGDTFGYYPWSVATYTLLMGLDSLKLVLLGNHDHLLLSASPPQPVPPYWDVIQRNRDALIECCPVAMTWLGRLSPYSVFECEENRVVCVHGTPEDPLNGRFYPNSPIPGEWFPERKEILLMGHTHYPFAMLSREGGLIANPGSVGQPRDSDARSSWGLLYVPELRFEIRRTAYDVVGTINLLRSINWYETAVRSLYRGLR